MRRDFRSRIGPYYQNARFDRYRDRSPIGTLLPRTGQQLSPYETNRMTETWLTNSDDIQYLWLTAPKKPGNIFPRDDCIHCSETSCVRFGVAHRPKAVSDQAPRTRRRMAHTDSPFARICGPRVSRMHAMNQVTTARVAHYQRSCFASGTLRPYKETQVPGIEKDKSGAKADTIVPFVQTWF